MPVNLTKGQKISLTKEAGAPVGRAVMGLGWDAISEKKGGLFGFGARDVKTPVDLDASCIMYDTNNQQVDVVWFRQLKSKDGSVVHTGDNRTGAGDGDDEQIRVNLGELPANVKTLVFIVTCYTSTNFSKVDNAYCRLVDETSNKEVARFNLSCQGNHTSLVLATITRGDGDWQMKAVGATGDGRTAEQVEPLVRPHLG